MSRSRVLRLIEFFLLVLGYERPLNLKSLQKSIPQGVKITEYTEKGPDSVAVVGEFKSSFFTVRRCQDRGSLQERGSTVTRQNESV